GHLRTARKSGQRDRRRQRHAADRRRQAAPHSPGQHRCAGKRTRPRRTRPTLRRAGARAPGFAGGRQAPHGALLWQRSIPARSLRLDAGRRLVGQPCPGRQRLCVGLYGAARRLLARRRHARAAAPGQRGRPGIMVSARPHRALEMALRLLEAAAVRLMPRTFKVATAFAVAALALLAGLSDCSRGNAINSPYPAGSLAGNTLFTAFVGRSPKYLDPASSYSTDETPYTYNIYETLYGYHYLKRPYTLVPRAAASIDPPQYRDAQGHALPADAPGDQIAESDYIIRIRPGIRYQPHPALARRADGSYVYDPVPAEVLAHAYAITDFRQTGTRELTAQDYVYGFRRLASPRVVSPIYALMAQYVVGLKEYGDALRKRDAALRQALPPGTRDLPWLDLREPDGFDGVQALDDHTLRIRVKGKYPQFKYWLAMTFTAP